MMCLHIFLNIKVQTAQEYFLKKQMNSHLSIKICKKQAYSCIKRLRKMFLRDIL